MGILLGGAALVGLVIGCVVSLVGVVVALVLGLRLSKSRSGVALVSIASALGLTILIAVGGIFALLPEEAPRGGGDYDVVMEYAFEVGLLVGSSLGLGSLGGVAMGLLCPRRSHAAD